MLLFLAFLTVAVLFGMSYVASGAQSSQGTLIEINQGNASPPNWVVVAEPLGCMFGNKNMFDDSTNLQSTAKEFLAILPDPGKVTIDTNRVPMDAGQLKLQQDFNAAPPTRSGYRVTLPINTNNGQSTRGDVFTFLGYVETFSPDVKTDKKITNRFGIQVTGPISYTQGA